jgi:hypothetical protein
MLYSTVWGIDSEGNQVRLYGFGRDTVVPANSNLLGGMRVIQLLPIAKLQPRVWDASNPIG